MKQNSLQQRYARPPLVLHAGNIIFGRGNRLLSTLLGSCVAITLWHPRSRIGGMCHFALPTRPEGVEAPDGSSVGRYGDDCMALFCKIAAQHSTPISDYQAKIFGGGDMLSHATVPDPEFERVQRHPIGDANSRVAYQLLTEHTVKIVEADVGEAGYRQLWFDPNTGDTHVNFVAI